jgi:hypothetical protein
MSQRPTFVTLALLLILIAGNARAQSSSERNFQTCLSGRYPALCNRTLLTPEQARQATLAEKRENLKTCMTGRYASLCDHDRLAEDEKAAVAAAERRENLRTCLTGKYPALCNHSLLTPEERPRVQAAESAENLRICLDGRFPGLCNRSLLSNGQEEMVVAAEARAAPARRKLETAVAARRASGDCDSHSIEAIEGDGKIIKLDDGSMWEVDDVDTVTTSIWLAASEAVVCRGRMINSDDDESVGVTPVGRVGSATKTSSSRPSYVVQAAANDETFVINDEIFEAKTYCFNFEKGDRVIFVSGSPNGGCSSAQLLNLRTEKVCSVWCE